MSSDTPSVTWSVTELHEAVGGLLEHAFGTTVWVSGELSSISRSRQGHTYFDLVDPDDVSTPGMPRLSVTLFDGYRRKVNHVITRHGGAFRMEDGTAVRVCGELKTYPAQSRLQLVMTGIDPTFTLGVALQQRDKALAALSADGLLEANGRLDLALPALHIALVTSRNSAAEADVLHELERSGIGFMVTAIDARTQGAEAETTLIAALRQADDMAVDAVLLVRGGGSRADLATFDGEGLGRAIASMSVPVLTGIGHEVDRSVADEVAHTAHKTPTAAAAALVERAVTARRDLDALSAALASATNGRLLRASAGLDAAARTAGIACRGHLVRERASLEHRAQRAVAAAPRAVAAATSTLELLAAGVGTGSAGALETAARRLTHISSLVDARDPVRAMARGWSITRTSSGEVVRSVRHVPEGSGLVTTVRDGTIASIARSTTVVSDTSRNAPAPPDHPAPDEHPAPDDDENKGP